MLLWLFKPGTQTDPLSYDGVRRPSRWTARRTPRSRQRRFCRTSRTFKKVCLLCFFQFKVENNFIYLAVYFRRVSKLFIQKKLIIFRFGILTFPRQIYLQTTPEQASKNVKSFFAKKGLVRFSIPGNARSPLFRKFQQSRLQVILDIE